MHTPGPWFVGHDLLNPITGRETLSVGVVGHVLAAVESNFPGDTDEHNASLIAAAPDLLAACEAVIGFVDSDYWSGQSGKQVRAMLRAAIAKATE